MNGVLNQFDARRIIQTVGEAGQPPLWGTRYFTDGFEDTLRLLDEDYFSSYLKDGGATFKLLVGHYGGGKTHFLYLLRELAWERGYVVAYVSLTPEETPFHQLDRVYRAVAASVAYPPEGREVTQGMMPLLKATVARWRNQAESGPDDLLQMQAQNAVRDLENLNYQRAMKAAVSALLSQQEEEAEEMVLWLSAQGHDRTRYRQLGIAGGIDRSNAFSSLRSLTRFVRQAGYSGIAILFDEAERTPSLSGKQREYLLSNLRELIDETARGTLQSTFVAYAIPDYRFFDGKTGVYEAVKGRTASMFDFYNPSGVRINLDANLSEEKLLNHLKSVGAKLARIYEIAYGVKLDPSLTDPALRLLARQVLKSRFADISFRRLFVQSAVRGLAEVHRRKDFDLDEAWAETIVENFSAGGLA